jgi:spore coat protein A, manganese oxidase
MDITRRRAIELGLVSTGMLLSPWEWNDNSQAAEAAECAMKELPASPLTPPLSPQIDRFVQPLPIPQPLQPVLSKTYPVTLRGKTFDQPIDYYEIEMRQQDIELIPARDGKPPITAKFWTYNGTIPGPFIHQTKNRQSCIRFCNKLGQDETNTDICTSVHLHGMASLPQYDGYANDLTPPNYYKDYYYPNNRASILWYHDHAVHKTSRNVYMGLAGMYIVDYAQEDFCKPENFGCLPKGEFEIPLVIQDKTFAIPDRGTSHSWKLVFNDRQERGVYADVILVNGAPWPYLPVQRRKYFFRILNASASRTFQLVLSGDPVKLSTEADGLTIDNEKIQLTVIGGDAGLLAEAVDIVSPKVLRVGVAERYGVIIDFSKFKSEVKHLYLRNLVFSGNLGAESGVLMRFDLRDGTVEDPAYIPKPLGILTQRLELEKRAVRTRTFRFGRNGGNWTINNRMWEPSRVEANVGQCDIEIWTLVNTGSWTHPVHVHLVDFQIIDRNGRPPQDYERGWKDVVLLQDLETVRVIARFGPHRGKYMIHCHNIVHEDHDMMTQFEVGTGGSSPFSDPAKPCVEAPPLGSTNPPTLIEDVPCKCFEPLANSCGVAIEPPEDCRKVNS